MLMCVIVWIEVIVICVSLVMCELFLVCFICMEIVICIDVMCVSCGTSCWPGHWYLSQGLAHVKSVVINLRTIS